MCRVVFITHLFLSLLIGTVYLVSEYNLDRFFWLFAASMLVSVLGYRLASDWALSGLTGLAVSGGLFLLFVTDGWRMMFSWLAHGNNALQGLIGTALLSVILLVVSKAKFFGFVKLITVIGPVTMASVNLAVDLPQLLMDAAGRGDIPSVQGSPLISNQHGSNRPLVTSPSEVPEEWSKASLPPSEVLKEWSKASLDAGKDGLARDTRRDATSHEVSQLKEENEVLKKAVAEVVLDNQRLKRSLGM